jgi:hypothetical protein
MIEDEGSNTEGGDKSAGGHSHSSKQLLHIPKRFYPEEREMSSDDVVTIQIEAEIERELKNAD